MPVVDGTAGKDVIHIDGDGTAIPIGFKEILIAVFPGNENDIIRPGLGDDIVASGAGSDFVDGGIGNDLLRGGLGDDSLLGGAGDDTLIGGAGADNLVGGGGIDTASYEGSLAGVNVSIGGNAFGISGDDAGDVISDDIENLSGSVFDDILGGTFTDNVLTGLDGNDRLFGGSGNDILRGGAGADRLDGGFGTDLVTYFGAAIGVTVNLQSGTGANGDAQGDSYVSIENVNGSTAGDVIIGNAGANVLNGFEGNDRLTGGAGKDTLTGGIGADRFVFITVGDSVVGANADRIADFSRAQGDKIDLSGIDASTKAAGNQAFSFIGSALYHHVAGELRFAQFDGTTTIAGDIDGDGASDFHIVLTGTVALTAADFVL
ncbi:MAG: hypothetical protein JF625_19180 [Inquilinus limosus]|uniref:Peptidase M10 serralysin C-terminal domain-containing protein n=1 Tax=Inquilinus limosus TaxID=171674 RepID=A0A952FLJ0_9PROT|nr:hypothetical protein [Inquilinus limosus]